MTSTTRFMRPLILGAVVLAIVASSGCGWIRGKTKSNYADSAEARPLEVPPDLDLPNTSAAPAMPTASGLGGSASSTSDVTLADSATVAYPKIGQALENIPGVTINGRAEALGSYDVTYQGQSFLIRALNSASGSGSRLIALSADGRLLNSGPAAELLVAVKAKL